MRVGGTAFMSLKPTEDGHKRELREWVGTAACWGILGVDSTTIGVLGGQKVWTGSSRHPRLETTTF